ncbi:anti-sigma factor [Nocardioides sp.]|uniref:anti-sigma factor n=1 Tax=Nocardioides sp. TaxID=35761 RepID=UPI002ED31A07
MSDIDIHSLVGAYAVDALDDLERAAFERHLAECAACRAEVDGLREAAAVIGSSATHDPPAGLRDRVLADIANVRPLPPQTAPAAEPAERQRRRFRPALVAAAAVAVLAVGGGVIVAEPWADDTSQRQPTVAEQVRAAEDAETFTQTLDDGAVATVIRSKSLNRAVLVAEDMEPAPAGKVYELWLEHEGVGMVAAGLMEEGQREVVLEGDPADAVGFGITVEPDGGSDQPTSDPVALIAFENA